MVTENTIDKKGTAVERLEETYDPDCARPANEYDALCKIEFQLKRIADIMERNEHYGLIRGVVR